VSRIDQGPVPPKERTVFPVTTDIVTADRSRRLEGFHRWSHRRHQSAGPEVGDVARPIDGHRPTLRPAFAA
jgi:hypothetical protein